MREQVFLCLGSNCGQAAAKLAAAATAISALPRCQLVNASSLYFTEPQEHIDQPWFLNQILEIAATNWQPRLFLAELLAIETKLGRTRIGPRYGPRTIDIDLLLFGARNCQTPDCLVPHPAMLKRAFVLTPLAEIAPNLTINAKTPGEWLQTLDYRLDGNKIFQNSAQTPPQDTGG